MGFLDELNRNTLGKPNINTGSFGNSLIKATQPSNINSFVSKITPNVPQTKPIVTKPVSPVAGINGWQDIGTSMNNLTRAVLTRPIRTVIKSFEELGGQLGDKNYKAQPFVPTTPVEKALFGNEPISSYPEQGKKLVQEAKEIQQPITGPSGEVYFKGVDKRLAYPLAVMGTIGVPLGDLLPGGGGKKKLAEDLLRGTLDDIIEQGLKTTDDVQSLNVLKNSGIDETIAKETAPLLTAAKDKKTVETILQDATAKQLQYTQDIATQRVTELVNKQKGIGIAEDGSKINKAPQLLNADEFNELTFLKKNITKPENIIMANRAAEISDEVSRKVDTLIEEARKYKSAEEFVKAQPKLFHGGTADLQEIKLGKSNFQKTFYMSDNADYAKSYGGSKSSLNEISLDKNANLADMRKPSTDLINQIQDIIESKPTGKMVKLTRPDGSILEIPEVKGGLRNQIYSTKKIIQGIKDGDAMFAELPEVKQALKKLGYDGQITTESKFGSNYGVWNKDVIKTKSQLTDIWKQAQSKNIAQVAETKAFETASGVGKERKYITSAKASDKVANEIKQELAGVYDVKGNKELVTRATERVSTDIEQAKKLATTEATDEAIATGVSLTEHYGNEIANASTKAEKLAIAKEAADVINKQAEVLTEAGRTIQAASLIKNQSPEGLLRKTAQMIKKYNQTATKKIAELSPETVVNILEKGKAIEKMPEGLAKEVATKEILDELESVIPSPWWKKITMVWKAGLLTGVKTSGVNISSNFFNGVAENIKNIPATGIDLATSFFTGKRTKALNLRGLGQGSIEGVKKGWNYLKTGISGEAGESALEFGKVSFDSKPGKLVQKYAETVYRILGTEDMPFYYGALKRSLGEQALVTIKNEGKIFASKVEKEKWIQDFIDNPPSKVMELADLDAKVATFKNDTAIGRAATALQNASPIAQVVLPFAKTPSAVATAMINYTPAGALSAIYRNFIKGPFNQKDFAEALGRSVTGTGALWLGSQLYEKGKISLGYPKEEKERAKWEATGKTPNSILIDGKWVPLVTFGPVGSVLGIGGYVSKGKDETGSISGGVLTALAGGLKMLTEQTFLTGIKNVTDAINEPEKGGVTWAGGLLASVIPTIVSDFNQAFDDYQRKSSGTILGPLKARIPGVRETLPKKLDVWGQPLERNRSAVATAISPIRLSNTIEGELNTEVERLNMQGEDVRPTKVDAVISNIKLTPEEHYKFQRLYGNVVTKGLTTLIKNKEYQSLDSEQQAKYFKDSITEVRKATGQAILPEILRARYDLSKDVDMTDITTMASMLYKKSPDFAKAPPEKQIKVINKLLGK